MWCNSNIALGKQITLNINIYIPMWCNSNDDMHKFVKYFLGFTFQHSTTQTSYKRDERQRRIHLHSNIVLLKLVNNGIASPKMVDLHSNIVLLKQYLFSPIKIVSLHLHSNVVQLKLDNQL